MVGVTTESRGLDGEEGVERIRQSLGLSVQISTGKRKFSIYPFALWKGVERTHNNVRGLKGIKSTEERGCDFVRGSFPRGMTPGGDS